MKPKLYHRLLFCKLVVVFFLLSSHHANAFSLAVTKTDVTCNGLNNGTATANTTGTNPVGTVYLWSNGATTKIISGLAPGNYSVTVTYGNSSKTGTASITQPLPLVATMSTTKTCVGTCNGSAFLTISGGTPPYTRQWSNGAAGNNLNNLCAGTYTVTITDSRGCSYVAVGTVAASAFVINVQSTSAGCTVLGTAIVTVVNDSPPISFSWSNGATTSSLSNLAVGTYTITVTNSIGCTATTSVNITQSLPVAVTVSGGTFCGTACSGIAVATATGGVGPYSFVWSNGATGSSLSGLCSGTYAVTVTDAKGCSVTTSTVINVIPLIATVTTTNANCNSGGSASVVVTSNGVGPFNFHWSTGSQTPTISGLSPGTYSVTVTDLTSGCTATATGVVGGSNGIILTTAHSNVTCGGACDGTAATTVTGGSAPFSFNWSNGATTTSVSGLCPGAYSVTVHDAFGCSAANAFTVTTPTAIAINTTWTNTTCVGTATGTATVVVAGGLAPYTFSWSNGATGATAFDLAEGVYCVTVADANGCTVTSCVQIDENSDPFRPSDSYVAPGCDDDCTAFIQLVFMGGSGPYSYQWSNGSTAGVLLDVCEGIYTVTASDANGCTLAETFEVVNYDCNPLSVTATSTNALCAGACSGTVSATAHGGVPPYTYLWSNGATTATVTNLCAGLYSVMVHDGTTTVAYDTVFVVQPSSILITVNAVSSACGACNGSVTVTVAGGAPPYVFQWSNGAVTSSVNGLCAGIYNVTAYDAYGCSVTAAGVIGTGCRSGADEVINKAQVTPNPNHGIATLNLYSINDEAAVLRVLDVTGKLLQTRNVNLAKGQNFIDIDMSEFANGVYMLQRLGGDEMETVKLIKQ